jgi:quercetin dioxygenase-like cupin family protein
MRILLLSFYLLYAACAAPDATKNTKASSRRLLQTNRGWDGDMLRFPTSDPCLSAMVLEIAPGGTTEWEDGLAPSAGYVIEGDLQVDLANGKSKRLTAGETLAQAYGQWKNGRNVGKRPVKVVIFYVGSYKVLLGGNAQNAVCAGSTLP